MRPRFSIAGLAAFVALCGVAFASIRSPSQLWASVLFASALASLPIGLLNAVYGKGRSRAYWVGFTTCGALYFVTSLGPWFRDEWGPRMATTAALDLLYSQVAPTDQAQTVSFVNWTNTGWTQVNQITTSALPTPAPGNGIVFDSDVMVMTGPNPAATPAPTPAPPAANSSPMQWISTVAPYIAVNGASPSPGPFRARWNAWTTPDRSDGVGWQVGNFTLQSTAPFRRIGHSLLTFACAALGGAYAGRRFAKMTAMADPA